MSVVIFWDSICTMLLNQYSLHKKNLYPQIMYGSFIMSFSTYIRLIAHYIK